MPPQRVNSSYKEGRLELAVQAFQNNQFSSIRAAARAYDVPRDTLRRRLAGIQPKRHSTPKNRLLTPTEEQQLTERVLSMDQRGMPPTFASVRAMASLLASEHGQPIQPGKCWVRNYINRNDALKSKYNRKYDYQRSKCEDPAILRAWFETYLRVKTEYGILDEDTYNFDETGF